MSKRFHVDPSEKVDIYEFESDDVISDVSPNVITIRARMDIATAGKVSSELMQLGADNKPELFVGAHVGALLLHNILGWRGPDFDDLPCTPANIRALPSPESDPFIEKVANAIGERNRKKASPNAKLPTDSGFATNGLHGENPASAAGISRPLATSMSKLDSRSALAGHLRRSDSLTPTTLPNSSDD